MKKNSFEIIPKQVDKIANLPKNLFGDVYIAYIPGESFDNVVSASKYIINHGFKPVPHVPARSISNKEELDSYLSQLSDIGVKKILAIGGSGNKTGTFEKTFDLFETGILNKYNFDQINIAGHPEGNPFDENSDENLLKKYEWIIENKFNCSIVSQWTFNVKKTNDWIQNIKRKIQSISNNCFDIHIGIAGPAKIITLIKYAKICGVSATFIIAKNKNIELRNLIKHDPNEIINGLENYDNLHFFPFGGIKELVKWKNEK